MGTDRAVVEMAGPESALCLAWAAQSLVTLPDAPLFANHAKGSSTEDQPPLAENPFFRFLGVPGVLPCDTPGV